jgi:hypothetical protein
MFPGPERILKFWASGLLLGLPGAIAGFIWMLSEQEEPPPYYRVSPDPVPSVPQHDNAPEEGDFGFVVHPEGVIPTGPSRNKIWPTTESTPINGRTYSLLVERLDPNEPTIWLPGAADKPGYQGRWGPRVTANPYNRRAGMRFPEFWEMFFTALAKAFSKP